MKTKKPGALTLNVDRRLGGRIDRALDNLSPRKAGLAGRPGFGRPGFGNFRAGELGGFGQRSFLGELVPSSVKPVPVILGTVIGVGFNTAVGRLLESPRVGVGANPLLSRVLLAGGGVVLHVLARTDFTLGFMLGQFPGLIEAGVGAVMDMALGETHAMKGLSGGQEMGALSRQALAELQALRRRLEAPAGQAGDQGGAVPMHLRAQAAA